MHPFSGILRLIVAAAAVNTRSSYKNGIIERDVIVVGGGSSGTYVAIRLQDEGHSVVVLEKEDHLGGHTATYTDPDTKQPFNLGVVVYHDSPIVRNYFGSLGVTLQKVPAGNDAQRAFYDFSTGSAVDGYKPIPESALNAAIRKYAKIVEEKYPYLSLGYDLPDPVPPELLTSYSEFIETNDLRDIVQHVNGIAGCTGDLLERPTLYAIKVFSPLLVQAAGTGFITAASGDNQDLYREAQSRLERDNDVILQCRIKRIKRSDDYVHVWADTDKGNVLIKAKKLVLAIPPTLENLEYIGWDLTCEEEQLLKKLDGFLYGSTVFTHQGIDSSRRFHNIGTDTPFNLLKLPGSYAINPLVGRNATTKISAYFGGLNASMAEIDIKGLIQDELDNLARERQIGEGEPNFKYFGNHSPYHLHVSVNDIREGFYKKIYDLEGKKNTFWTGATFVDNDSTLIWTWTESYLLHRILDSLK